MIKKTVTINIEVEVYEAILSARRKFGFNVSKFCNAMLRKQLLEGQVLYKSVKKEEPYEGENVVNPH